MGENFLLVAGTHDFSHQEDKVAGRLAFSLQWRTARSRWVRCQQRIKRDLPDSRWWLKWWKSLQKICVIMYPFGVILKVLPTLRPFPKSSLLYFLLYRTNGGIQLFRTYSMQASNVWVSPFSPRVVLGILWMPSTANNFWLSEVQVSWSSFSTEVYIKWVPLCNFRAFHFLSRNFEGISYEFCVRARQSAIAEIFCFPES
jgi:hypothetical protein